MKLPNIFGQEAVPVPYQAQTTIFNAGDDGEVMYIVQDGEVELRVHDKPVASVLPDEFFGEMALLDQPLRSASAVAKTDCHLIPITRQQFIFMVEETPFFALEVMRALSSRLRRQDMAS